MVLPSRWSIRWWRQLVHQHMEAYGVRPFWQPARPGKIGLLVRAVTGRNLAILRSPWPPPQEPGGEHRDGGRARRADHRRHLDEQFDVTVTGIGDNVVSSDS